MRLGEIVSARYNSEGSERMCVELGTGGLH
jgi:hypothetical protein